MKVSIFIGTNVYQVKLESPLPQVGTMVYFERNAYQLSCIEFDFDTDQYLLYLK